VAGLRCPTTDGGGDVSRVTNQVGAGLQSSCTADRNSLRRPPSPEYRQPDKAQSAGYEQHDAPKLADRILASSSDVLSEQPPANDERHVEWPWWAYAKAAPAQKLVKLRAATRCASTAARHERWAPKRLRPSTPDEWRRLKGSVETRVVGRQ
jgi:hypothetical protein